MMSMKQPPGWYGVDEQEKICMVLPRRSQGTTCKSWYGRHHWCGSSMFFLGMTVPHQQQKHCYQQHWLKFLFKEGGMFHPQHLQFAKLLDTNTSIGSCTQPLQTPNMSNPGHFWNHCICNTGKRTIYRPLSILMQNLKIGYWQNFGLCKIERVLFGGKMDSN